MATCRLCRRDGIREWLDFGPQAISNRFLRSRDEAEYLHPCKLGVCRPAARCNSIARRRSTSCGRGSTGSVTTSRNATSTTSPTCIAKLPGVTPHSTVGGLTYKDDSTLARLNALGFAKTWRPSPRRPRHRQPARRDRVGPGRLTVADRRAAGREVRPARRADRPPRARTHVRHPRGACGRREAGAARAGTWCSRCRTPARRSTASTTRPSGKNTSSTSRRPRSGSASPPRGSRWCPSNRFYYSQEDLLVAIVKPAARPYPLPLPRPPS